ncbi:MAG: hypothetical protein V4534_05660 [Myxococcota bacterium]
MRNFFGNEPGDGGGNRRSVKDLKVPYDGIGNQLEHGGQIHYAPDNVGNSIDSAPTHHLSSVTRKKSEHAAPQRLGRYLAGGVNPLVVAGLSHLNPDNNPAVVTGAEAAPTPRPVSNQAQNDKRLRRLFEFDEDDRAEYSLTSTPEEKCAQIEQTVKKLFDLGHAPVELTCHVEQVNEKPFVSVAVKTPLFKNDEISMAALNFLVNKMVNRAHSDRIRLAVKAA